MTPEAATSLRSQIREAIAAAWQRAEADLAPAAVTAAATAGATPATPATPLAIMIERPSDPSFGDFASNLAMKLAKPYRRAPMDIAKAIAARVTTTATDPASPIASVDVAPPGFLNVRLSDKALAAAVAGSWPSTRST